MKDKSGLDYKEFIYYLNLVFSLSWTIVGCIAAGGIIGFFIDKYFLHKIGLFFIIGLLLGIIAGFFNAYRMILKKDFFK